MRFAEFNEIFNPAREKCYFSNAEYTATGKKRYLSFLELTSIIRSERADNLEIGYELQDPFFIVETKDEKFAFFVKNFKNLNTYIIKSYDTYIYFFRKTQDVKNLIEYTTNTLVRGAIKVRTTKLSHHVILPFKTITNTSELLENTEEFYAEGVDDIDDIPFELKPIVQKSYTNYSYPFPIKKKTLETLTQIINQIKPIVPTYDDICKIISAINILYCSIPLNQEELEELLQDENLVSKSFFDDGVIRYDRIAKYLIAKHYIKYNDSDNLVYYYDPVKKVYINDDKYLSAITGNISPVLKTTHIDEVIETIKRITYTNKVTFNESQFTVLFKNGVFNLVDGTFTQMAPDILETNLIGAEFIQDLKPNAFVDDFFSTLTCGDTEVEQLLYEAMGYSMFRTSEFQVAFLLYGGGKNGKSTLFDVLRKMIGTKNSTNVSFKDLSNTFRPSMMENKLISIAPDISSSDLEDSDVMKSIIAGEDVTLERKNKDPKNKPLHCTMWFGCNKLPRTSDTSYGFYRRFVVVPMNADLSKVKRGEGKKFHDSLMRQENIDYVANMALRAFFQVYHVSNEFIEPDVVKEQTEKYRDTSDSARQYINKRLERGTLHISNVDSWDAENLYPGYKIFCDERGNKAKGLNSFELSVDTYKEEIKKRGAV